MNTQPYTMLPHTSQFSFSGFGGALRRNGNGWINRSYSGVVTGMRSQYQNPVCSTWVSSVSPAFDGNGLKSLSPIVNSMGLSKIGPAKQKVWYSPFSPQGSVSLGSLLIKS